MDKIVIIEDSHLLMLQIKKALEECGYSNIVEFITADAVNRSPSLYLKDAALIILDIGLPGISGIDFAKGLKNNSKYGNIPIMFISGNCDSKTVRSAVKAGGVDYIAKPFKHELLVQRIEKIMDTYYGEKE